MAKLNGLLASRLKCNMVWKTLQKVAKTLQNIAKTCKNSAKHCQLSGLLASRHCGLLASRMGCHMVWEALSGLPHKKSTCPENCRKHQETTETTEITKTAVLCYEITTSPAQEFPAPLGAG